MLFISTRAQIWGLDAAIAFVIFMGSLIMFYKFAADLASSQEASLNRLVSAGTDVTNLLLAPGYPPNWNLSSVVIFGLTDNERLNETKVYLFSQENYNTSRQLLSFRHDFYLFFEQLNGTQIMVGNVSGAGKPGINSTNVIQVDNPANLVKIDRLIVHNATLIRMKVYVW